MEKSKMLAKGLLKTVFAIAIILLGIIFYKNTCQMSEKRIEIPTKDGILSVTLCIPKTNIINGTIIFIHGDGFQNTILDGGFKPAMEPFHGTN